MAVNVHLRALTRTNVLFFIVALITWTVPYLLEFSSNNFINKFYANRLMAVATLPFLAIILARAMPKRRLTVRTRPFLYSYLVYAYWISLPISLTLGALNGQLFTPPGITQLYLYLIPWFMHATLATSSKPDQQAIIASVMAAAFLFGLLDLPLKFGSLPLLLGSFLIWYPLWRRSGLIAWLFFPFGLLLLYNGLDGKSALVTLAIAFPAVAYAGRSNVSPYRLAAISLLTLALLVGSIAVFPDLPERVVTQTTTYQNLARFFEELDLLGRSFDPSTGNRIFEAQQVIKTYSNWDILRRLLGNGFGSTIDISATPDPATFNAQSNPAETHHVHLLFFAVLLRHGILGAIMLYGFLLTVTVRALVILRHAPSMGGFSHPVLAAIYTLMVVWDGQVTSGHLLSNYLFWFSAYLVLNPSPPRPASGPSDEVNLEPCFNPGGSGRHQC